LTSPVAGVTEQPRNSRQNEGQTGLASTAVSVSLRSLLSTRSFTRADTKKEENELTMKKKACAEQGQLVMAGKKARKGPEEAGMASRCLAPKR
jgi:hypothetical protein